MFGLLLALVAFTLSLSLALGLVERLEWKLLERLYGLRSPESVAAEREGQEGQGPCGVGRCPNKNNNFGEQKPQCVCVCVCVQDSGQPVLRHVMKR